MGNWQAACFDRLLHGDKDLVRNNRWTVRNVQLISQYQLQGMSSWRQRYLNFSLSAAEMPDGISHRFVQGGQLAGIDQEMVVTGVGHVNAGW
jgi:hypothetical protein